MSLFKDYRLILVQMSFLVYDDEYFFLMFFKLYNTICALIFLIWQWYATSKMIWFSRQICEQYITHSRVRNGQFHEFLPIFFSKSKFTLYSKGWRKNATAVNMVYFFRGTTLALILWTIVWQCFLCGKQKKYSISAIRTPYL